MIDKIKLHKIYDVIIEEKTLTKSLLNQLGITEEEITSLINDKILTKTNSKEYALVSYSKLFNYGIMLKNEGNVTKATKCLITCHKQSPQDRNILLNLLHIYIRTKKQDDVYKTFKLLELTNNKEFIIENNLILCLLQNTTQVPNEYKERVKNIKLNDITFTEHSEYQNIYSQNKMRKYILENKFILADKILRKDLQTDFKNQAQKSIISTLLTNIIEIESKKNAYIKSLIEEKKYSQLVSYLERKHQIKKLNLYEAYVYKISSSIIRIKEVNKIPKITVEDTVNLKEAIIGNNYQLALKLLINKSYPELSNIEEKNIVITLLKEINQLITKIIKEHQILAKKEPENDEKQFLLEQLKQMQANNEIIKILENIDEKRKPKLIQVAKTIPELSLIVPRYKDEKIILRNINISYINSDKTELSNKALNAYISGNYELAILIYTRIIQTEEYLKADICGLLALSYLHLNDVKNAIKYMEISIQLDKGHKENKVDYKTIVKYLKETQTELIQNKIEHIVKKHDAGLITYDLTNVEKLAYYINSQNMTLSKATKELNLTKEDILLIKLIYARDYYIEEKYSLGDKLVEEVSKENNLTLVAVAFLTEVKRNRNNYKEEANKKIKKLN